MGSSLVDLYDLIRRRYERGSLLISSNRAIGSAFSLAGIIGCNPLSRSPLGQKVGIGLSIGQILAIGAGIRSFEIVLSKFALGWSGGVPFRARTQLPDCR